MLNATSTLCSNVSSSAARSTRKRCATSRRLTHLVDLHDVGVLQPGNGLGLGAEACQVVRPCVAPRQDHLEGDQAVGQDLPSLVDDAHAAPAQLPQDFVAGHINTAASRCGQRSRFTGR
jgi:hypothetical protein